MKERLHSVRNLLVIAALTATVSLGTVLASLNRALGADHPSAFPPAPAFALPDLEGRTVKLADFQGRPLVVMFWASWDEFSREQIPILIEFRREWDDLLQEQVPLFLQQDHDGTNRDLAVVGITLDGFVTDDPARKSATPEDLKRWAEGQGIRFPILVADRKVIEDFGGVEGVPTVFVLDRRHRIVAKHTGVVDKTALESDLRKTLSP